MQNEKTIFQQAMTAHQNGNLVDAYSLYQLALSENPSLSEALMYLGVIECQRQNHSEAVTFFAQAEQRGVRSPILHINYGLSLMETGDLNAAEVQFTLGAELAPEAGDAFYNLGRCRLKLKKYNDAATAFEKSLQLNPNDGQGWLYLSMALIGMNRPELALPALEKVKMIKGDSAEIHLYAAQSYENLKQYEMAIEHLLNAKQMSPDDDSLLYPLARCYAYTGSYQKAEDISSKLLSIHSGEESSYITAATVYSLQGKWNEAKNAVQKALELNQDSADGHGLYGYILAKTGATSKAQEHYEQSAKIIPQNPTTYLNMANNLIAQGRVVDALECSEKCLKLQPENESAFSNILLHMHYLSGIEQREIFGLTKKWAQMFIPAKQTPDNFRIIDTASQIKIGILSGDLRRHSVAFFIEPLLDKLPQHNFKIFVYSNNPYDDQISDHLKSFDNTWHNIRTLDDFNAKMLIAQDNIDVMIDLSGHTDNNRLRLFAQTNCPIKINWLGYPDTTGLSGNVYRLVDNVTDTQQSQQFCSECLVYMPGPFICYTPPPHYPDISKKTGEETVFGSFNALAKISDLTLQLWGEILRRVNNSKILLKSRGLEDSATVDILLRRAKNFSIDPERLILRPMTVNFREHLYTYNEIDIALDTFPYNGTTTTCEALLMGRQAMTLAGESHHSRVGASILLACGLESNIAMTPEEYIQKAVELANNNNFDNSAIRRKLLASALCKSDDFCLRFIDAIKNIITHHNSKYAIK